jgi:hypothetical protein
MSANNVKEFYAKVEGSKALQAKLQAMHKKTVNEDKAKVDAKVAAGVVKIAAAEGFEFTAKDLAKAHKEQAKKLPAASLADVTGQEMCYSTNYFCTSSWYCAGYMYSQP